jgi:hypothetical protein
MREFDRLSSPSPAWLGTASPGGLADTMTGDDGVFAGEGGRDDHAGLS